jgi:hypothetical protein
MYFSQLKCIFIEEWIQEIMVKILGILVQLNDI